MEMTQEDYLINKSHDEKEMFASGYVDDKREDLAQRILFLTNTKGENEKNDNNTN